MAGEPSKHGISTLMTHVGELEDPRYAHVTPIYQTSAFRFPDTASGADQFKHQAEGFFYSRLGNPNQDQFARKIAVLEGLDLLRANPENKPELVVDGLVFSSGMAAIAAAIMSRISSGQTIIAQEALYAASNTLLQEMAARYGVKVVWLSDPTPETWEAAFLQHPDARIAYAETPANPALALVDLAAAAEVAHRFGAWLVVDNTFATPYCQRPLTLGADVVVHSTTKYLGGHGTIVGGAVISRHVEYVRGDLFNVLKLWGASASPFDSWLGALGMKTFELRMERHCANAMRIAEWLEGHPAVARVHYPGLKSHPQYALAKKQMLAPGGMLAFELKNGLAAGEALLNSVKVATLVVSLGNVDTLIQHPASMTHAGMSMDARRRAGISDGLVRLSVGIENVEDLIDDLDQGMK